MAKTIKATGDGACLFNAVSIGLSVEILSGRLDSQLDTPGYQTLLDEFAKHHPQFNPKSWKTLKEWLAYYNDTRDIELILAPVLFNLNQKYQDHLDEEILNELTNLVWKNKANIENGQAWFQLQNTGDLGEALFPKLENLDLKKDRTPLLDKLREILKDYKLELTRENVKQFLTEKAKELLSALKKKISSDPHAFQRGYSCDELKGMTDALAISLVENREEDITDNRIKIRLENQEEHWNVLCNEEDSERFLDSTPSRLKMTSLEAYRGDKQVSAPTSEQLDLIEEPGVFLRERTIDNPGLGNCAFYAFAIGLVNIIQEEAKYNRRTMFDRWVGLDRSIFGQYDEILKLNLEDPDKELLDRLQSSLRIVTYQYQIRELRNVCVFRNGNYNRLTGNSNFVNFAALYYGDPLDTDSRFNPFADSVPILMKMANIDRDSVHPGHENDVLVPLFLDLLYGDTTNPADITLETEPKSDSPIITAMNNITQDFFWGTHLDLNYLAEAFEVNLHVLRNNSPIQEFVDIPERHTLTLTNSNNTHWTTQITTARATTGMLLGRNSHLSGAKRIGEQQLVNEGFPGKESANDFMIPPFDEISNPHHKKEVETNKPIGKGFFHDRPVVSEEQRKLEQLKRIVANATLAYTTYSESIWFCFFHYHGQTGRDRANNFCKTFSKITDYGQAKEALVHYLNDSRNGNTHPHSYRTMLLHELQGNHDNKKDLQYLSRHFTSSLNKLASVLEVQLFANRYVP
ncbi:TPA: Dot/Icm T4SS effector Lem21 [Legionella pneumophila]|uniref:Dot/Icm T4SS effector Lem21 n=1 Tax=Legionella pneumophila TaxID=446 RepID=UPI0007707E5D|nr:Dot/Icm T4SS effector Lem21 [Legionella pneumophila]AMQ28531.1 hypothetical protein lpt_11335 [Legionella pneumophila subsp. pneumophila]MBN5928082.1 Dot/Icm T4SS effector Lem21 [Legionella pneumophila]PQM71153.1 hypothetical protein C3926_11695 [Legionella pneumophila]RYX34377.1 hypothetical protein D7271_04610 [Legionella pneumophila]RYX40432.1 hypothetical protein D7275_11475 [Legionella pneumophila]